MDLRRLRRVQNVIVNRDLPARSSRLRRTRPAVAPFENDRERVEALLALLTDRRHGLSRSSLAVMVALSVSMLPASWLLLALAVALRSPALTLVSGVVPFLGLLALLRVIMTLNAQRVVLHQLSGYDDVRVTGPLVSALRHPDKGLRHAAQITLTRVLPCLTLADAAQLTPACRARLYRYLTPDHAERSPDFICAILKVLEQIGDQKALDSVSILAYGRSVYGRSLSPMQKQVQQAARECLPFLSVRIEQAQVSQSLLRATQEPTETSAAADVLLHPVSTPAALPHLRNIAPPDA